MREPLKLHTPVMLRETFELLGMDFSQFYKYKACQNSNDKKKIATTPVWIIEYTSYNLLYPTIVISLVPSHVLKIWLLSCYCYIKLLYDITETWGST